MLKVVVSNLEQGVACREALQLTVSPAGEHLQPHIAPQHKKISRGIDHAGPTVVAHQHPNVMVERNVGVGQHKFLPHRLIHRGLVEPDAEAGAHVVRNLGPGDILTSTAVGDVHPVHIVVRDLTVGDVDIAGAIVDMQASHVVVALDARVVDVEVAA